MQDMPDFQKSLTVLLLPRYSYAWCACFHYHQVRYRVCERSSALWYRCFDSTQLECNGE